MMCIIRNADCVLWKLGEPRPVEVVFLILRSHPRYQRNGFDSAHHSVRGQLLWKYEAVKALGFPYRIQILVIPQTSAIGRNGVDGIEIRWFKTG